MESLAKCPCCKSDESSLFCRKSDYPGILIGLPDSFSIRMCQQCGTGFVSPVPTIDEINTIYSGVFSYESEFSSEEVRGFRKYMFSIGKALKGKKGKLLDVGCASGKLLKQAHEIGWDVYGVDISDELIEQAGKRVPEASIQKCALGDAGYPDNYFDAVTALNLLEHVVDPPGLIDEVYRILKPGGVFLFKTVRIDSIPAKKRSKDWDHLKWPGHIVWFSKNSLVDIVEKRDFHLDRFIVTGVPYIPGVKKYLDNREQTSSETAPAAERKAQSRSSAPVFKRVMKTILRIPVLKATFAFFIRTFRIGDTVTVLAVKNQ